MNTESDGTSQGGNVDVSPLEVSTEPLGVGSLVSDDGWVTLVVGEVVETEVVAVGETLVPLGATLVAVVLLVCVELVSVGVGVLPPESPQDVTPSPKVKAIKG